MQMAAIKDQFEKWQRYKKNKGTMSCMHKFENVDLTKRMKAKYQRH